MERANEGELESAGTGEGERERDGTGEGEREHDGTDEVKGPGCDQCEWEEDCRSIGAQRLRLVIEDASGI